MSQAIRSVLQKYATFGGRASRSEYWYWILAFWMGWYIVIVFTKLFPLYDFGLFIPTLAVGVRRLHDSNHSGWWILLPLVNLVLLVSAPVEPNRYGGGSPAAAVSTYAPEPRTSPEPSATSLDQAISAPAPSDATCPSCGTARGTGQNFCRNCGTKFD